MTIPDVSPDGVDLSTPIPDSVTRMYPNIPADSWERLSEHRYRAVHPNPSFAVLVVAAFGETLGRGLKAGAEQKPVWASMIEDAARLAGQRVACEDGTPIVRPTDPANAGVAGRCWWCGLWPGQHTPAEEGQP